ncbi:MAG: hypothetical protein QHJ73_17030, partial [Armatimonadota bacterium]|nr:hypothetical protein [Armatimonadota bacterium]
MYQVFHSIPSWARADGDTYAAPDDLRDIYRFARALARHFRGRVQAWEVWNEPDIRFFSHPSSECAAFQKAAFLGFRAEDPTQLVLGPSMAHGPCPFAEGLLQNGVGHYLDVWNYHIYADPSAYAARTRGYRDLLRRWGVDVPFWVTEAGDRVRGPQGILSRESRVHQAAFVSRAFAQALAAGVQRHFWFVFPFYREGEVGWGVFEPDQRAPFPALAALATATYAMGRGRYLGRLEFVPPTQQEAPGSDPLHALGDSLARALGFDRGDGSEALVVWREADQPAEVVLPLRWWQVKEARNHVGTPLPHAEGEVRVSVGRAAPYFILPAGALKGKLTVDPAPAPVVRAAPPALPAVVVRLRVADAAVDKDSDTYVVAPAGQIALQAEVYNFGDTPFEGEVQLSASDGWHVDRVDASQKVLPGERAVLPTQLHTPDHLSRGTLTAIAAAGQKKSAPAVLALQIDGNRAKARATYLLPLDRPEAWAKNIAEHGSMEVSPGPEGGVRFHFLFSYAGDNWAYPQARFDPPLDLSA